MAQIVTLGPQGTYSVQAAQVYDAKAKIVYANTINEAIQLVADGTVAKGVIPLENSIHGIVAESLDGLAQSPNVLVVNEQIIDIHHAVCAVAADVDAGAVHTLYSHPQAVGQCRNYIAHQYPNATIVSTDSTAAGLQKVAELNDPQVVAIGSAFAAPDYGLNIVAKAIEDEAGNQTRFVVIAQQSEASLPFTMASITPEADRPGLLFDVLGIFKDHNVNLSQIDSRPSRTKLGSYVFYVRLEIAGDDQRLPAIIEAMKTANVTFRKMSV